MRLIDADRLLDRCIFYHLPNGNLAVPIIDVQHAPTVEAPDINVGNMDTTTHDSIPAETGKNDGDRTSGDCISRQVVAKFLSDWLSCLDENCHKQSASDLKMIIKDFKNLPSAQPERKTGRWIEMSSTNHTYKCSECGRLLVNVTDGKNNVSKHYPYCHCGAKMEGGEVK